MTTKLSPRITRSKSKKQEKRKQERHAPSPEKSPKQQKSVGEDQEWTCPITLEPFQRPILLGDGVTYEENAVKEWMRMHSKPKIGSPGPTGIPIVSLVYGSNKPVASMLEKRREDVKKKEDSACCPITLEPFQCPVAIVPKKTSKWTEVCLEFFEAPALTKALEATWGQYNVNLADAYISDERYSSRKTDNLSKSLAETHVALPNRLLMDVKNGLNSFASFQLPKRGPGPVFDQAQVAKHSIYQLILQDEDAKSFSRLESKMTLEGTFRVFRGIRADQWIVNRHCKFDKFVQCLFVECIFAHMCWCSVEFVACRFVRCTFSHCTPKGLHPQHTLNCEFKQCTIVSGRSDASDMQANLIGVQTEAAKDALQACLNFQVVTFDD